MLVLIQMGMEHPLSNSRRLLYINQKTQLHNLPQPSLMLVVLFLWVDANGNAHHVEQLPGQGYALVDDEAVISEEPVIVVAEAP